LRSFTSTSVAPPTRITATPPADAAAAVVGTEYVRRRFGAGVVAADMFVSPRVTLAV
jgi:hypothetical protein